MNAHVYLKNEMTRIRKFNCRSRK